MPSVQVSGTIPNAVREGTTLGGWTAGLSLGGDTGSLAGIELTGAAALNFSAHWDAVLRLATISLAAPVDYRSFAAAGRPPQLDFGLRFVFTDGSRQTPAATYHVAVLDQDDAPPSGLHLIGGGSLAAGAIGSVIGTLAVTDPDSTGPFLFSFAAEDDWRFEVVGSTLKLRDGISLGLDEMPGHPLFINVSDGHQSAAFTLDLTVTDPGMPPDPVSVVTPETPQDGFALASPQRVVTLHDSREVTVAPADAAETRPILLAGGGEVWLPAVERLQMTDGWVDFDPTGGAVRAAALVAATTAAPVSGADLGILLGQAEAGQGWVELAAGLLPPALPGQADAGLVDGLYQAALQRAPDAAELALQLGRLASGVSRAQLAADLAGSAEALAAQAAPEGHWVAQPLGGSAAWHLDTGGPAGGPAAAASYPVGEAWLF
ncbi:DUF4214 domain-containing protein [Paeniroseomonas aquatica]|uniref:DUF4214 domain-containing protein n=1 Tax=Paeniroseomonas aquatica TaxID=373043 RepID=UPI00360EC7F7